MKTKQHFFQNPTYPQKKIFIIPDPPHLIKLLRNHWQDKSIGYKVGRKLVKFGPDQLKQMMDQFDGTPGSLMLLTKLKPSDIDATGSQRQRVGGACRVFSDSVAQFYRLNNEPEKATFIGTVNNW